MRAGTRPTTTPGLLLGAALGELALAGRDKVTFLAGPDWEAFPDWAEQLVAESTGKDGRGIVPVVAEPPRPADEYGEDRVFVGLVLSGEAAREAEQWGEVDETPARLDALEAAGHPVLRIRLEQPEELGALFLVWEVGVAMAGVRHRHPPLQPARCSTREASRAAGDGERAGVGGRAARGRGGRRARSRDGGDRPRVGVAPVRSRPAARARGARRGRHPGARGGLPVFGGPDGLHRGAGLSRGGRGRGDAPRDAAHRPRRGDRGHDDARPRPALPPLDRPAAQGGARTTASSCSSWTTRASTSTSRRPTSPSAS